MRLSPQARLSALMLAFLASLLGLIAILLTPHQLREWRNAPGHVESSRMLVVSSAEHRTNSTGVLCAIPVHGARPGLPQRPAVRRRQGLARRPQQRRRSDPALPAGKAITVYYNPRSPAESVLIKGGDSDIGSAKFILAALSALFGWALLYRLRARSPLPRRRIQRGARVP